MTCCCPHDRSAGKLFSRFAPRYRRRFERKGFEPSQRQLLAGLARTGCTGASVLEIGSGVGHLHQTLLENGAASAVGVDLAADMIAEAGQWARQRGLAERVRYHEGDFVFMHDELEPAELTILDKVVCCYPDAYSLIHLALDKTRRVFALTYPRDRRFIRFAVAAGGVALRLAGSDFRPYVHDPRQIQRWIEAAGFQIDYEAHTPIWLTQVYARQP